ncbi:ABC transporter permease [Emticicia sp. SJ17W-69]|uniref:ABC transporter permease n=1 Tax=Emticicia sp. SJ17W-69 TaxID=3421657 RepID=UPI003EBA93A6
MLKNYIKIAWRNLIKRKFYSLITIFGLSVGITFTLLIGSYVWGELRTNGALKNAENQYMIQSKWKKENMGVEIASLGALSQALKQSYPNLVENYYRFDGVSTVVSKGEKIFREDLQLGDSTLLTMYGFPLIHGDARTALQQPNSIVISSDQAIKYFGKSDVIGQSLTVESFSGGKQEFMITGVLDKLPYNSITNLTNAGKSFPILMSFSNANFFGRNQYSSWNNPYIVHYVELNNGVKKEDLEKPLAQLIAVNVPSEISQNLHTYLVPLKDVYQEANNGIVKKTIWTLSLVAVFILLMSIVNFVNISIGASSSRLKEIGVRKVLGGTKKQVLRQFLTESIIISIFSLVFSLVLYQIFRPSFEKVLQKEIISVFHAPLYFFLAGLILALLIGLLSGAYPAFVLATLPSVDSMKGKLKSVKENVLFRRLLIVSQFAVALFVFGGAMVVSKQVNYFFNKDLGYNKASVFSIRVPRDWSPAGVEKMETIRNEMAKLKEVSQVSLSWIIPDGGFGFSSGIYKMGQDSTQAVYTPTLVTDEKYAETYQIPLLEGQFFQAKGSSFQPNQIVLNEEAIKSLGFKQPSDALGQKIRMHYSPTIFTIAGICKNFHFESMHKTIGPIAFMHVRDNNFYRYLSFRIHPTNLGETMTKIEAKWKQLMPNAPFEYTFTDDTLQKLYQSEIQLKRAAEVATVLALIIVLLGILGVVSLSIVRRTKELGIRKVLGASSISIIILFMKEFLVLMLVAIIISLPFTMMGMNKWLQNYSYRIDLTWFTFALVGVVFALIVLLLVGFQTLKAALINPVESLKAE